MCRLLFVKSKAEFEIKYHLNIFSEICQNSKEYQGHGWGCSYLADNKWTHYKNITPIWEDDFSKFKRTKRLIVHARSAFQDKDIAVENNMPFYDDNYIFVFNGELNGVKIKSEGRIGAEKIFNFIKRFNNGDMNSALEKSVKIINKRSKYVRAMNIFIADKESVYVSSTYNEDPDYFGMHYKKTDNELIICSEFYPNEANWKPIENNFTGVYK
jgi:predicted glutamine amidotransferase